MAWDKLIEKIEPDAIFRIEDGAKDLFKVLKQRKFKVTWNEEWLTKTYNSRHHDSFENLVKDDYVLQRDKVGINEYCNKYGYDNLFD